MKQTRLLRFTRNDIGRSKSLRALAFCHGAAIAIVFIFTAGAADQVQKIHPKEMFNHEMHTEIFTSNNIPCETCHIKDAYTWDKMNHLGCHECHGDKQKPLMSVKKECSFCHANWPVKPPDHKAGWHQTLKTKAKIDRKWCENCHNDRFCIKCHEQRNTIKQNVHRRNFRYFHSIEARMDPKKCDRCHQVTFCTSCHTSPRGR